jgi:hypothetical protein
MLGRRRHAVRILAVVFIFLLPAVAVVDLTRSGPWDPQQTFEDTFDLKYATLGVAFDTDLVDSRGNIGLYTSIGLDSNDRPHISYYDETEGDLRYVRWTGFGWLIDIVDTSGDVGLYTSIAVDSEDRPHISYYRKDSGDLKYAWHDGERFQIKTVDEVRDTGLYSSIALDLNDKPFISYYEKSRGALKFAKLNGTMWETEYVDDWGDVGLYTSLALNSTGVPHISYYDKTHGDLKYIKGNETGWNESRVIDGKGDVGLYSSLALSVDDVPYVSYYDKIRGDLKYATFGDWYSTIQRVDRLGIVGLYSSIALDSKGDPHISYYDKSNGVLKYASRRGFRWDRGSIQEVEGAGQYSSLAIDSNDRPHISLAAPSFFGNLFPAVGVDCDRADTCSFVHIVWMEAEYRGGYFYQLIYYKRSSDKGATWDIPLRLISSEWRHFAGFPNSYASGPPSIFVVGRTVHVVWAHEYPYGSGSRDGIFYQRSTDNGVTWLDEEVRIDDFPPTGAALAFPSSISIHADNDYVNVVWESDQRIFSTRSLVAEATSPDGWKSDLGSYSSIAVDYVGHTFIASYDRTHGDLTISGTPVRGAFDTQIVEEIGNVGEHVSLALDSRNYPYPYISYYDVTNGNLKYASWDGSEWKIETVDSNGNVGLHTSLALDSDDYPHIAYYDETWGDLKYARWNGTDWIPERVADLGDVGQYASLDLDSMDRPQISYYDDTRKELKHASWNGTEWVIRTVDDTADVGKYSSLAIDLEGLPHISYYDETNQHLRYAHLDDGVWDIVEVDSSHQVGEFTSIALDSNDKPHISYYDGNNTSLKYARLVASEWEHYTLDNNGDVGKSTSIAFERDDEVHISYYDEGNRRLKHYTTAGTWRRQFVQQDEMVSYPFWGEARMKYATANYPHIDGEDGYLHLTYTEMVTPQGDLKYAVWNGTDWRVETVDEEGIVGNSQSFALDSNDYPHISYYDEGRGELKYARWNGTDWITEVVDTEGNVGMFSSLALDSNDYAHITYHDLWNGVLKYAKWDGESWHTARIQKPVQYKGLYSSIAIDRNDNPHVIFYDFFDAIIWYGYFDGSEWKWRHVDSLGWRRVSLTLDSNDYPHMSYVDRPSTALKYTFWNGTAWVKLIVGEIPGYTGTYSSIALDKDDTPMFSYFDETEGDLRFARPGLLDWETHRVDTTNDVGQFTSLAVDDYGIAHISYYDVTGGDLKYAKWVPGGWHVESVDTEGDVGLFTSLALDSYGYPHISYFNESDGRAVFYTKGLASGEDPWTRPAIVSDEDATFPAVPRIAAQGQNVHVVWEDIKQGTPRPEIYYAKSTDNGDSWPRSDQRISNDIIGRDIAHGNPRIQVSGATVYVIWERVERSGFLVLYSELVYDSSRINGDPNSWGEDEVLHPDLWAYPPFFAIDLETTIVGNDLHAVWVFQEGVKIQEIMYEGKVDTLSKVGELLPGRKGAASVYALNSNDFGYEIFVIGGEASSGFSDNVTIFDPTYGHVKEFCNLPKGLAYASAVWDGEDSIFVFGGLSSSGAEATILEINLTTSVPGDRCTDTGISLSPERYGTSAVYNTTSNTTYIFGGIDGAGNYLEDIVKWPRLGAPVNFGLLPSARSFTSAVWDGVTDKACVFGGEYKGSPLDEIVEFQDVLGTPLVQALSNARLPSPRFATSAAFDGTYAYIIGGKSYNETLSEIVRFNPNGDWEVGLQIMCPEIPTGVENSSAVMFVNTRSRGRGIFVIGGGNESSITGGIWRYVPSYWELGN